MADLSVTVGEVKSGDDAVLYEGIAGATVTAGQAVYLDPADNKLKLAIATSAAPARVKGLALHASADGQPLTIQTDGDFVIGATAAPTAGLAYVLSGVAGGISPHTDVTTPASGEYLTVVGVAAGTGILRLCITASEQALA
jgi:hypothetical protein